MRSSRLVAAFATMSLVQGWLWDTVGEFDASELLMGTEWFWNGWRNVRFHAPRRGQQYAKFTAPTEDCESGLCSWLANTTGVFIMWGDAGLHHLVMRSRDSLTGTRVLDGEPCEASLVGSFEEDLFDLDLYAILHVNPDANAQEIRQSYRRLSLQAHPDKGGTTGDFVTLHRAFEVLSDKAQREDYDHKCASTAAAFTASPAVTTFGIDDFRVQVEGRLPGGQPWLVIFTMGPDSPWGPCHQLRPIVREAAEVMRNYLQVGVVHCDVARFKPLCDSQMEGRGYYPIVKLYGAPGVQRILDLEPQRPELPSGTLIKLMAVLVEVLVTARPQPKRFWVDPAAP